MRSSLLLVALFAVPSLAAQPTRRPTDIERGAELWSRHCASCHGAANHGDGPATAALVTPVPDLAGKVTADRPTIELVLNGKGAMPGYLASFEADDARRVLQHMSTLGQAPPASPAPPEGDDAEGGEGAGEGAPGPG